MPGNSSNIKAGGAYVVIGADSTALEKALKNVEAKFRAISKVAQAIGTSLIKVGLSMVAPFIAATKVFTSMGEELLRMSQRTGVAVSQLSALGYAAQHSGVDMETLEGGIRKMQKAIGQAAGGSKEAVDAFAAIGLSVNDLVGLAADQQIGKIADAISRIPDPTAQAVLAMKIFGKSGTEMLPLLNQGSAGIAQMEKRAKALGIVLSDDAAKSATELSEKFSDLGDVMKNSFFRAGEAVAPIISKVVDAMTAGIIATNRWITAHKPILQLILKIGGGLVAGGVAFIFIGKSINLVSSALGGFGTVLSLVKGTLGIFSVLLGALLNPITLVIGGIAALAAYLAYSTDTGRTMLSALGGYFTNLKDVALETFGGVRDALASGDWKLAAEIAWTGLKLAWDEGVAPLKSIAAELKASVLGIFAKMWAGILDGAAYAFNQLKNTFEDFRNIYQTAVNKLSGWRNDVRESRDFAKALGDLQAKRDKGEITQAEFDTQDAELGKKYDERKEYTDAQNTNAQSTEDTRYLGAKKKNDDDLKDQLANIAAAKKAVLNAIDDEEAKGIEADKKHIEDLKAKLRDLGTQSHKEGGGKGLFSWLPELPNLPPIKVPAAGGDNYAAIMKSVGGFGAHSVQGLGPTAVATRQLEAAKKTNEFLASIAKYAQQTVDAIGGAVTFGP